MQALSHVTGTMGNRFYRKAILQIQTPQTSRILRVYASTKTPYLTSKNHGKHVSREEYRILVQEVDFRKTEIRINDRIDTVKTDLTKEISAVRTELKETEIRLNDRIDTVKTDLTKEISKVASSVEKLGTGIYRALFGALASIIGIIGAAVYSHPDGRNYLADIVRGEPRK